MPDRERFTVGSDEDGKYRGAVIRGAIGRYKQAMDAGFYLEAITLMESLIADRLESHICAHTPNFKPFNMLGPLAKELKNKSNYSQELAGLTSEIFGWTNKRNAYLHELAKIEANETDKNFADKYKGAEDCAIEGYQLFNKISSIVKKDRKNNLDGSGQK